MTPRIPKTTKRFRREYAKFQHSGKKIEKLDEVMLMLTRDMLLPPKHKDHALQGQWQGTRDCHIEGDWILLYKLGNDDNGDETITFCATDNHENLFG